MSNRTPDVPLDRLGSLAQFARIDRFTATDGPEAGARRIRMVTGGGLDVDIHPDRGLDLGHASIDGIPVAWVSPTGFPGGWAADGTGAGWLGSFGGGLLATCGLRNIGRASVDGGEDFGMHGRIGSVSARVTRAEVADGALVVAGELRETSAFGDDLVLRRSISAHVGGRSIRVEDSVRNEGAGRAAFMLLHHLNLGWPLHDEGASVDVPSSAVEPRDEVSAAGLDARGRVGAPRDDAPERVFLHRFDGGRSRATVANERLGLTMEVESTLPYLFEWSYERAGAFVLGIEPSSAPTLAGRGAAREAGVLDELEPGEERRFETTVSFRPAGT